MSLMTLVPEPQEGILGEKDPRNPTGEHMTTITLRTGGYKNVGVPSAIT
jgi:hypothetical protein